MPDSSLMLDLCGILNISVNDLLSGEVIGMENSNKKNEQLLLDMAKEVEDQVRTHFNIGKNEENKTKKV